MMQQLTVRLDSAQFAALSAVAKSQGKTVSEIVRQRVAEQSNETVTLLALLAAEIDDQQATLAAILAALENLAALRTAPPSRAMPNTAKPYSPEASPAPQKRGTGESWQSWIVRQPFTEEDNNSPSARARRVWRQFEDDTGNEAPPQFRSSAPSQ